MLSDGAFDHLQGCIENVVNRMFPATYRGRRVAWWRCHLMRAVLKVLGVDNRTVWVADSSKAYPRRTRKISDRVKSTLEPADDTHVQTFRGSPKKYGAISLAFGMLDERVKFLQGWFKDTLPTAPIDRIAVLRLDGDYYESIMDCLVNLYDKLSVGALQYR